MANLSPDLSGGTASVGPKYPEMASMTELSDDLTAITVEIVIAYIGGQHVETDQLPDIIRQVHATMCNLSRDEVAATASGQCAVVPIRESVFPDRVVCLECGFSAKVLRQHLSKSHGLTPEEYRARWALPSSYPIVAPDYAQVRAALARKSGLGTRRQRSRR